MKLCWTKPSHLGVSGPPLGGAQEEAQLQLLWLHELAERAALRTKSRAQCPGGGHPPVPGHGASWPQLKQRGSGLPNCISTLMIAQEHSLCLSVADVPLPEDTRQPATCSFQQVRSLPNPLIFRIFNSQVPGSASVSPVPHTGARGFSHRPCS